LTRYRINYSPEAEAQLDALHDYIAIEASPEIAKNYLGSIMGKCESLADFPSRGSPRSDLRPGLRTIPFRRRVTIIYATTPEEVLIIGVFYAGQDFEGMMREDD